MKTLNLSGLTLLLCMLLVAPALAARGPEKFVYDVNWSGIKAGSAEIDATVQGDELRIVNTVRSSWLVSSMFSIDDKTESVIPRDGSHHGTPTIFREQLKEGNYKTHKEARFNQHDLTAEIRDFLAKTERNERITPRTYDHLSSIFFLRSAELTPGQSLSFDIYDFKRLWKTEVRVQKGEEVRTRVGSFKTLKVTSQLSFNGTPARAGNTTLWLSDDSRRIPVRIESKLKKGEMTLTLTGGSYWR